MSEGKEKQTLSKLCCSEVRKEGRKEGVTLDCPKCVYS
jgi:hypothetical protein